MSFVRANIFHPQWIIENLRSDDADRDSNVPGSMKSWVTFYHFTHYDRYPGRERKKWRESMELLKTQETDVLQKLYGASSSVTTEKIFFTVQLVFFS